MIDYREVLSAEDFALFARLRDLRKTLAQRDGVPPYSVFTNEQLAEIAQAKMTTLAAISSITGVGEARCEKYGRETISAVTDFLNRDAGTGAT